MKLKKNSSRFYWLLALVAVALSFNACDHQQKERTRKNVDDLQGYVQRHKDSIDLYLDKKWDSLDYEFSVKKAELEKDTAKMDENVKQSYYSAVNDWNSFKTDYTRKASERGKLAEMDTLRNSLTMTGVRNDYSDLTAANILAEYEYFVNTVRTNKETYSKEQWTVINVSWKALNGRAREIEKDISRGDAGKIAKQQLEYTGIKVANRPFADSEDTK